MKRVGVEVQHWAHIKRMKNQILGRQSKPRQSLYYYFTDRSASASELTTFCTRAIMGSPM